MSGLSLAVPTSKHTLNHIRGSYDVMGSMPVVIMFVALAHYASTHVSAWDLLSHFLQQNPATAAPLGSLKRRLVTTDPTRRHDMPWQGSTLHTTRLQFSWLSPDRGNEPWPRHSEDALDSRCGQETPTSRGLGLGERSYITMHQAQVYLYLNLSLSLFG